MASQLKTQAIVPFLKAHRISLLSAAGLAITGQLILRDYNIYLSYGPGGLPYNIKGWLISALLRLLCREPFSTKLYTSPSLPFSSALGFLPDSLPKREGKRPKIGPHPIPQRQLDQLAPNHIKADLIARFETLALQAQENGLTEWRQSVHERQHRGVFVSPDRKPWNEVAQETRGEIAHVHAGLDCTLHVVMAPADCKKVIDAGWGQRHGLDGVKVIKGAFGFTIPVNYVLIYAPRSGEEIEQALGFVKAAIAFMTGVGWEAVEGLGKA